MKKKFTVLFLLLFLLNSCVGASTKGVFGSGVSIALDPRTIGTQIDDSIMQKNLQARLVLKDNKLTKDLSNNNNYVSTSDMGNFIVEKLKDTYGK